MPAFSRCFLLSLTFAVGLLPSIPLRADPAEPAAPKPLFRDPVYDGAADTVVVWDAKEKSWLMFYTNRRAKIATVDLSEKKWIHGTRIGIAESKDGGTTWTYRGVAKINYGPEDYTQWAPEIVEEGGIYHLFLTIVPGTFDSWNHPREIVHLTTADLLSDWKYEGTLKLASDRVIDPCVIKLPDGTWRMWYNNERDKKSIYYAESKNLFDWEDRGKITGANDRPGEGPKVFHWKGAYWLLVDTWKGQGVYKSTDALNWTRQEENLLGKAGTGADDNDVGRHCDVVVSGDRAFLFYFTHPGMTHEAAKTDGHERTRSSIQVVELHENDGVLSCDREAPTHVRLLPPSP